MINKRKKKYKGIQAFDIKGSGSVWKDNWYGDDISSDTSGKFDSLDDLKASGNTAANLELGSQLASVQTASDDRADAEESNLDILDRGSRYKRKNEKLKKFKV